MMPHILSLLTNVFLWMMLIAILSIAAGALYPD